MSEWQPIETAPKDGEDLLLWWEEDVAIGCWWLFHPNVHPPRWVDSREDAGVTHDPEPTHWMPLPEPPK